MTARHRKKSITAAVEWNATAQVMLIGGFVGSLVISQILAVKIASLTLPWFGEIIFPAGVFAYASTFIFIHVLSECYGHRASARVVAAGLFAVLLMLGLIQLGLWLNPASSWNGKDAFRSVLGVTVRMTIASITAYCVSQFTNIWTFRKIREKTRGKQLWLRNNLATMLAQALDTTIFISIAYYGSAPLLHLILGQIFIKWVIAIIDTPLVYILSSAVGRRPARRPLSIA